MKKILVLALCSLFLVPCKAVNYCASSSWGYGASATGGGNATPTLVSNETGLKNALKSDNKVIIITNDITISGNQISCSKNNLTIMALPGKKLISNNQTAAQSGILAFSGTNIILRNITFIGPGAYDVDGKDNLTLSNATNVWVDHCDFQDGMDGNFDINEKSDNITVTWCRFRYLKAPKAGGSGGADDHRFSNLVGGGSNDKPQDGTYNITYGFCWWDAGCKERMTRCRNCNLHFLNCYWNSSVANYYVGPENAACYFEGCTFEGSPAKNKIFYQNYGGTNGSMFVNCSATKGVPSNVTDRTVLTPTYSYDQLSAADAKNYVTNASCGAGATLTVTNAGAISSGCDGDDPEPVDPPTPSGDLTWNFSTSDFTSKDSLTIDAGITINGLTIGKNMVLDQNSKTISGLTFTHRLKTGGTGSSSKRYLKFDVTGPCTIEVYLVSAGSADRTLNIYSGTYGSTLLSTMTAPQTTPVKQSYNYTGGATSIYMGSANSGINLYGINLIYSGSTGMDFIQKPSAAHKVLRHGQVLILRDGKTYNLLGQSL